MSAFLICGVPSVSAQYGSWVDNAMRAKKAIDAAQNAKKALDAANTAKRAIDTVNAAKRAVNAAHAVQNAQHAVQGIQNSEKAVQHIPTNGQVNATPLNNRQNIARNVNDGAAKGQASELTSHVTPRPRTLKEVLPRSGNWAGDHHTWPQRGGYAGFHIPNERFRNFFGPGHPLRIDLQIGAGRGCFSVGGFGFAVIDPVPVAWGENWYETDDVTVSEDDADGGYYLADPTYPGVSVSVGALQFGCSHFAVGFSMGATGIVTEDPVDQGQVDNGGQADNRDAVAPTGLLPQVEQAPLASPQVTDTQWIGEIVFQTGGNFLVGKMTRTLGHGGPVTITFSADGTFSLQRGNSGNQGTWNQVGQVINMHIPAHGCNGQGATFTGSYDGMSMSGTWFETSGLMFGCGPGSGTWQLNRLLPDAPAAESATEPEQAPQPK